MTWSRLVFEGLDENGTKGGVPLFFVSLFILKDRFTKEQVVKEGTAENFFFVTRIVTIITFCVNRLFSTKYVKYFKQIITLF
jgi:hypothetical protein